MSVLTSVRVATALTQSVIDAIDQVGQDVDTLTLRFGVMQMLRTRAAELTAGAGEHDLLDAYLAWLGVAVDYYGPEPQATFADYVRAAGRLQSEATIVSLAPAD